MPRSLHWKSCISRLACDWRPPHAASATSMTTLRIVPRERRAQLVGADDAVPVARMIDLDLEHRRRARQRGAILGRDRKPQVLHGADLVVGRAPGLESGADRVLADVQDHVLVDTDQALQLFLDLLVLRQ